jgi:MFS family permease
VRGIALAIAASAPIAAAAVAAPLLSGLMAMHGWRVGYMLIAAASAIGGAIALLLMPGRRPAEQQAARSAARMTVKEYLRLANDRTFLIIAAGLLLSNLTLTVQAPNLSLMLIDKGVSAQAASLMVSIYAIGIVMGRLGCGLALDRYPSYIVAVVGFGMPGIGLVMLGSNITNPILLGAAVMIVGQALGAELAITAYLIMRYFKVELYGTIFSMMYVLVSLSALLGSVLLSMTLRHGDSFAPFLILSALCTIVGGATFALLGRLAAPRVATAQP